MTAAWTTTPYDVAAAATLERELGVGALAATILARRGYGDPAAARAFLAADVRTDAAELPGISAATELVLGHVRDGSPITVFGDYDVDGVCSTAITLLALRAVGARPDWRLPARAEGYGLTVAAVDELAARGTRLLITVDCGVTAVEPIAHARAAGLDVVVCDHHRPAAELPDCPIVHPALGPHGRDWAAGSLCAAGVALKLSEALRGAAGLDPAGADAELDLAGLATVCDMVELTGENRRLARTGMEALARTRRPGLAALIEVAGLEPADVDAAAASFRLGPRLNAAGRVSRPDAALELVLCDDAGRAAEVARELDLLNADRRDTERRIVSEAAAACPAQLDAAALVVAGEGWHPGVVGIVAARLVERFGRPAVVIALDGEGGGQGSARSIPAYDLHAGLAAAGEHLRGFGGHPMAAGLTIDAAAVPAFRAALAAHAGARLGPADLVRPVRVDAVAAGADLSLAVAEELARLGPFGSANPAPTLLVPAARVEHVTAMGKGGEHARFSLVGGGARARCVAFRRTQRSLAAAGGEPHDVAVTLERNRWKGRVEGRAVLRELAPAAAGTVEHVGAPPFWDAVRSVLDGDPRDWWAEPPGGGRRAVRDRRDAGPAAACADALTAGGSVLCVVADVERRRAGLAATVAGLAGGPLAVADWQSLDGALTDRYSHLVAIDPPPAERGEALLAAGDGVATIAWGDDQVAFTLGWCRHVLGLRAPLAELWRALAPAGGLDGPALERALRGAGTHPRDGRAAGRMVRVLAECGLVEVDPGVPAVRISSTVVTELSRSAAYRAYAAQLAEAERYLGGAGQVGLRRAG